MAAFDSHIADVGRFAQEMRRKGSPVKELHRPGSPEELVEGLPVAVGPGSNPGIILRSDTYCELGNPEAGSCATLLWTDDPSLVRDGRITVFGPDLSESDGGSLPFGQILMAAGEDLEAEDHLKIQQAQHVSDQIEGYMVRSSSQNVWSRVSREAAGKGFDLETLGRALMHQLKSEVPAVSAAEVLFVTTSKEDVKKLDGIASDAKTIGSEIVKETWKARGYDLDCDFDCGSCDDREVCDEVRDAIAEKTQRAAEEDGAP